MRTPLLAAALTAAALFAGCGSDEAGAKADEQSFAAASRL